MIFLFLGSVGGLSLQSILCEQAETKLCSPPPYQCFLQHRACRAGCLDDDSLWIPRQESQSERHSTLFLCPGAVTGFLLAANDPFWVIFIAIALFKLYVGEDRVGLYKSINGYGLKGARL